VGYAVTGRPHHHGYLQRLAVDPAEHRHGVGRALVLDSLAWLRRHGATSVLVNTQESNRAALRLYEDLGFEREPHGLDVLVCDLDQVGRASPTSPSSGGTVASSRLLTDELGSSEPGARPTRIPGRGVL
jgi:hypothetical protein